MLEVSRGILNFDKEECLTGRTLRLLRGRENLGIYLGPGVFRRTRPEISTVEFANSNNLDCAAGPGGVLPKNASHTLEGTYDQQGSRM